MTFCWVSSTQGLEGLALRGKPEAVIDQLGIARDERVAQVHDLAVHRERFHLAMGEMQDGAAGGFIDAADFMPTKRFSTMSTRPTPCLPPSRFNASITPERRSLLAVHGDAVALARNRASRYSGVSGASSGATLRRVTCPCAWGVETSNHGILEDAGLVGDVQEIAVHRIRLLRGGLHGNLLLCAVFESFRRGRGIRRG